MPSAGGAAKDVHASMADRAWREAHAQRSEDDSEPAESAPSAPEVAFEVVYAQGATEASSVLQRHLRSLR